MTAKATKTQTACKNLTFGDQVLFTNSWGQERQLATIIRQDGDILTVDYLNCQHEINTSAVTKVL
jgi:hypothetical protein